MPAPGCWPSPPVAPQSGLPVTGATSVPEDFTYLVIADDPPHDTCYYPDSGKLAPMWQKLWGPMPEGWRFWQPLEGAEYFTGEE